MYGYEHIPTKTSALVPMKIDELPGWSARRRWGDWARSLGLSEAVSNSMVDPDDLAALGLLDGAIRIANPIAPELSAMRPNLLVSLVIAAAHNLHHGRKRVALFEIGRVFGKGFIKAESIERWHLGIVLSGTTSSEWWRDSKPRPFDASDIIGVLEQINERLGIASLCWEPYDTLHLVEEAFILYDGEREIGYAGRIPGAVHKDTLRVEGQTAAKRFDLDHSLWIIEINCETVPLELPVPQFESFSRFPMVERDLSYQVPVEMSAGTLLNAATSAVSDLPFSVTVTLFDRHEDKKLNLTSLGIRLRMQAEDRTLTEQEIAQAMERTIAAINGIDGVSLRGSK